MCWKARITGYQSKVVCGFGRRKCGVQLKRDWKGGRSTKYGDSMVSSAAQFNMLSSC